MTLNLTEKFVKQVFKDPYDVRRGERTLSLQAAYWANDQLAEIEVTEDSRVLGYIVHTRGSVRALTLGVAVAGDASTLEEALDMIIRDAPPFPK